MQSVPVNYSQRGDRSHDKHLADRMRDLLYLMERFGCGAAALQKSGLHFLIARSIDLQIIRGVIRASSGIASLHSLHKPKGLLLWSFFLAKSVQHSTSVWPSRLWVHSGCNGNLRRGRNARHWQKGEERPVCTAWTQKNLSHHVWPIDGSVKSVQSFTG